MGRLTINVGEAKVSRSVSDTLVTHALGSCMGIILYDPQACVAGLLHYMLPASELDPATAAKHPFLFADTGIRLLIEDAKRLGAKPSRSIVLASGGARMLGTNDSFDVGQRNQIAMRAALAKARIRIHQEDIGGHSPRSISIAVATGRVRLCMPGAGTREVVLSGGMRCLT